jgi:hypothetical protein
VDVVGEETAEGREEDASMFVILNSDDVRAVLDGTKTGHRMPLKSPHAQDADAWAYSRSRDEWESGIDAGFGRFGHGEWVKCPLGAPGSRVWVRETWVELVLEHRTYLDTREFAYKASCDPGKDGDGERCRQDYIAAGYPYQWRSPVTMPRWASRIELEITAVRVIRVDGVWHWDCDWRIV